MREYPDGSMKHLLWTSGFDSTFRLLEILFRTGDPVQPLYLVDLQRRSGPLEMRRMALLRREILKTIDVPERLRPTRIYLRDDFPIDDTIGSAYRVLKTRTHVGSQYEWLAQAARDLGFPDGGLEMCMTRHEPPSELHKAIFDDPYGTALALKPGAAHTLFRSFAFPTLRRTKADMQALAVEMGVAHILEQTWFCHDPVGGRPCGHCAPCRIAKAERKDIVYAPLGGLYVSARRSYNSMRGMASRVVRKLR
jgi:7-cyano-7-deazaguanine synthase